MKIQDPRREHPPFDIAAGQWPMYQSQGYHQFNEIDLTPEVEVRWFVSRGRFIGDYEDMPYITVSASGNVSVFAGPNATKSARMFANGRVNKLPEHLACQYEELFAEWSAKSKRKGKPRPVEQVSANTPKIPGVSPYSGSDKQPWSDLRNK